MAAGSPPVLVKWLFDKEAFGMVSELLKKEQDTEKAKHNQGILNHMPDIPAASRTTEDSARPWTFRATWDPVQFNPEEFTI